jgi:HAE1 family hydrophobic/amphiphilic exporter-1
MNITDISIKRPVTILMCVLILLVLGFVSLTRLPIDLMPNIDFPIAVVSTTYQGVGPGEIESIVTKNIESAVATVNNIKSIQSQSSEGVSMVIAEFNSGTDMNFATLQMREKIDLVKRFMPDEVETPMVIKVDPSMLPIASLGVTGNFSEVELKSFAEKTVKQRLESIDGVASVSVTGGKTREIKVDVDPEKVSGYGISPNNIINALQTENLNQPGGTVEYGDKNLLIRSTGEFGTLDQIRNVPVILPTGSVIHIYDVAKVKDGFKTESSYTRMNGENSVGVTIQKQTDSNTVKVVNLVKKEIQSIKAEHPDININVVFDQGIFIERSINTVFKNAVLGALLAILILFIFLKNIRTTLIIGTAIPISIIGTFVLLFFTGITLNLISLGGLALGVGMLVDNSIVVLENIYRYRMSGYNRVDAAKQGTQEVTGAVVASTLTTIGVFLPIAFIPGITAQIFKELALTVTFSLFASLIIALTFIPMLSSKLLIIEKPREKYKKSFMLKIFDKWDSLFRKTDSYYRKILERVLQNRKKTILIIAAIFILSMLPLAFLGREYFPQIDQGQFTVKINTVEGGILEETEKVTRKVEEILLKTPEIEKIFVTVGGGGGIIDSWDGGSSNRSSIKATLKPLNKRGKSTQQVVEEIRNKVSLIPGADISVTEMSMSMGGGFVGGSPVSVRISGPELDKLASLSNEVEELVKNVKGTRQVESSVSRGRPEARVYVDRDKAAQYGIGTAQTAQAIRTAVEGRVATRYRTGGEEIDIRVQLPEEKRNTFEQLKNIMILSPMGNEVPLSELAQIKIEEGPVGIMRDNQQRYVTVNAEIFGKDTGSVNSEIKTKLNNIQPPPGYSINLEGQQSQMEEAFSDLSWALVLAVVLVYMIMAAQFESLLYPFVIMFSVPLAYAGSSLGLAITGRTLNVPSLVGVIILGGIVVNNAIVLVDYINKLRERGMERTEAILKAGPTRLRPILMTTLTTVLGLIPLAMGIGEGAEEMEAPLATVVIGGLITSTLMTLVIIPIVYTIFDDLACKVKGRREAAQ